MTIPKVPLKKVLAVIVGVTAVSVGVFFGFRAVSGRAAGEEPQGVSVVDINENTATVTWTSGIETQCTLEYGTTPSALSFFSPEDLATTNHSITLTLLSAATTYYFDISCNDKKYLNGGVPWSFSTGAAGGVQPPENSGPTAGATGPTQAPQSQVTSSPAAQPTGSAARPSPIQTLQVPSSGTGANSACSYSSCADIKSKLGPNGGCSTQDYSRCLQNQQ